MVYYNEYDPGAAEWLRCLIADGLISDGDVDARSLTELPPDVAAGRTRAHFFSGIAGWEVALALAGWPADRPVWTGSCPCQPYSSAGKGRGAADERDLWPVWLRHLRECRPECVFGEQVESAIRHGWLDRVRADLEAEGYAVGACVLGAHSVGAPHIRQRLYWVAHAQRPAGRANPIGRGDDIRQAGQRNQGADRPGERGLVGGTDGVADADGRGRGAGGELGGLPQVCGRGADERVQTAGAGSCAGVALGDASSTGREGDAEGRVQRGESAEAGFWGDSYFIACRDGKARRVPLEPALFPLAHGVPGRVGLLRGAGNAIVPQVAAEFVRASLEAEAGGFDPRKKA